MGFRYPDDPASPLRWAQLLDRASADAAIPLEAVEDAGWILRFSPSGFNRYSSVWPRAARGDDPVGARLERAEAFYIQRNQPPRLVLSPASVPVGIGAELTARRWGLWTTVDVLCRRSPEPGAIEFGSGVGMTIAVAETADDDWLAAWAEADHRIADNPIESRRMASMVATHNGVVFVSARDDRGATIGIAKGVIGAAPVGLGVFNVWVRPDQRRHGIARMMMDVLHREAAERGLIRTWLQVEQENAKAQRLYSSLGYRSCYSYQCWERSA